MSTTSTPQRSPSDVPPRVAVVTCRDALGADEDAPILIDALAQAGIGAVERIWDDPDIDWSAHDLVVLRSTWDYALRRDEFLDWAERVQAVTDLRNPIDVVRWNTDKRYLADLAADGVAVTPTEFLLPEEHAGDDDAAVAARIEASIPADAGFVVKPTVSAGSKDTVRYASRDEDHAALVAAAAQAADLLRAGRAVMVQPYLQAVDTEGETGLVYLGGEFSHAFRKGQLLTVGTGPVDGLYAEETISAREATVQQRRLADAILVAARRRTGVQELYARVDLVPDDHGAPVLLELELTEPSFFLHTDPGAAARAAAAIAAALS